MANNRDQSLPSEVLSNEDDNQRVKELVLKVQKIVHTNLAMNKVADQDGNITTRQTFSEMLDILRQRHLQKHHLSNIHQRQQSSVQFQLPIQKLIDPSLTATKTTESKNNNNNNNNKTNCHCNIAIPSPFIALAFALRYKLQIQLQDHIIEKFGID